MGWESPRLFLIGFPIVVVIISILLQGSIPVGGGSANNGYCNYNTVSIQCANSPIAGSTVFTCPVSGNACTISQTCPAIVSAYPPTFCSAAGFWILPGGYTVTIPNSVIPANSGTSAISGSSGTSVSGITASFSAIGPQGWTLMIGTVITIAVLAGFNFFGSGESNEGVHILFESILLLGIWVILSVIEGITTPGSRSMFLSLNAIPFFAGIGTLFYVLLSLFYTMGVGMWVSRGGL